MLSAGLGGQQRMAKPLSMDLRERVVAAVLKEGMSARRAAVRSGVSESSAIKWVRRQRETGSVAQTLCKLVLMIEVVAELDRSEHQHQHKRHEQRHLRRGGAPLIANKPGHRMRNGTSEPAFPAMVEVTNFVVFVSRSNQAALTWL